MTISGDLQAHLTKHVADQSARQEIAEYFFDWLTCGDVVSFLQQEHILLADYFEAVDALKRKVL